MFLVSMADIIGSYERLPNDAVRAVAVAKRREYRHLVFCFTLFNDPDTPCMEYLPTCALKITQM